MDAALVKLLLEGALCSFKLAQAIVEPIGRKIKECYKKHKEKKEQKIIEKYILSIKQEDFSESDEEDYNDCGNKVSNNYTFHIYNFSRDEDTKNWEYIKDMSSIDFLGDSGGYTFEA